MLSFGVQSTARSPAICFRQVRPGAFVKPRILTSRLSSLMLTWFENTCSFVGRNIFQCVTDETRIQCVKSTVHSGFWDMNKYQCCHSAWNFYWGPHVLHRLYPEIYGQFFYRVLFLPAFVIQNNLTPITL